MAASAAAIPPVQNLWDQIVRQEQVVLNVIYKGRQLNVWKQNINSYTRYYVTPLCNIDMTSLSCEKDEYSATPRSVFSFKVKLWDFQVATIVQKALKRKNITAETGDIVILPMQFVRVSIGNPNPNMEADEQWTSFSDEPLSMSFRVFPKDEQFCQKMLSDIRTKTEFILSTIKLEFEFSMVASSTASRHIKIKANFLQKSSFYSNLANHNADKNGSIFLTSDDTNKLAHEVFNSASFDEEISDDYKSTKQEQTIINELLKTFEEDKVQSIELSKENWDSVFWDDTFTRPDLQTSFLNETMTYDAKENQFNFDQEKANAFRNKVASSHSDGQKYAAKIGGMFEMIGIDLGGSYTNTHSGSNSNEVEK
uniref:Uncharacterized protein n=1 Tax=Panagrolaimus sp. PS1159 TaxID=55785 RepID=A0AC35G9U0_9BILA